jgi:hypothetical protein
MALAKDTLIRFLILAQPDLASGNDLNPRWGQYPLIGVNAGEVEL